MTTAQFSNAHDKHDEEVAPAGRWAVEAVGLTKSFGSGNVACRALRGVDLRVDVGEFVMLSGPSGSGKTTLLSILGCVLSPSEGEVRLFGERISHRAKSELPEIRLWHLGFVFQGHHLIDSITALHNVALPLQLRGESTRRSLDVARTMLARLGLSAVTRRMPAELSGGERQRVAIARALVGEPELILADEPTASLDAENGLAVMSLLRNSCREAGATALVVTHDTRIYHLADRVLYMDDGRISEKVA